MTPDEAERGAAERHEFRTFEDAEYGEQRGVCWCGWKSLPMPEPATRGGHWMHQKQEALQRSFEPRAHP
jgi:hypothetical protein